MDSETLKDRIKKMYKGEKITKTKLVKFEEEEINEKIDKENNKNEKVEKVEKAIVIKVKNVKNVKNEEEINKEMNEVKYESGIMSRLQRFFGF